MGTLVFGGTTGSVIGVAQWVAIRKLKIVRFWIPVTIFGFTMGMLVLDLFRINRVSDLAPHWLIDLTLTWILPALLAALFQTIVFFYGGLRVYLWPIIGALPMLFAGTGYSIGSCFAFPAGFIAAIISAITLRVVLRQYQNSKLPMMKK